MRLSNSVSKINSKKQFYCCVIYFSQEPALGGLVGDRWIHSLYPRLSVDTTSTGTYGHHLSGKRPYTTTREPGNKHDRYGVAVFVDETGLLSIGNNDAFLLRDVHCINASYMPAILSTSSTVVSLLSMNYQYLGYRLGHSLC